MRYRLRTLMILLAVSALFLYVGSFLAFQATPHRFDLAKGPQHFLVIFSMNTDLHCAARTFYSLLIASIPGYRHYPTRQEHERLVRFKHRFPAEG